MALSYNEALDSICSLGSRMAPRQYLKGMEKLLKKLNNPQKSFSSVLVSGTNGKGSVVAMTSSALKRGGFRTGRYLSPHIDRFSERMCINDKEISKGRIAELYETVSKAMGREAVTFFEFVTCMSFVYFHEEEVDYAVLEAGLGGRLDATNIAQSSIGAITSVGLDHTDVLGTGLKDIAAEKAGIVRRNSVIITAEKKPVPLGQIKTVCKQRNSDLRIVGKDIKLQEIECTDNVNRFLISGVKTAYEISSSMLGRHQGRNAAVAVGLAEEIGVDSECIEKGVGEAVLPCRTEVTSKKPRILMDCAHNPDAAAALSDSLKLFDYNNLVLVIGMMADKNHEGFIRNLGGDADIIITNQPKVGRAFSSAGLFCIAKKYCRKVISVRDVMCSLEMAEKISSSDDLICIAGSIYMLAEARGNPPVITQ